MTTSIDAPIRRIRTAPRLRRRTPATTLAAAGAMYAAGAGFLIEQSRGELGAWAVASDVATAAFGLSLVPLVRGVAQELEDAGTRTGRWTRRLGMASAGLVLGGSSWLVAAAADVVPSLGGAGLAVQIGGFLTLGGWLVLVGSETLHTHRWSRPIGWAAAISGVGHIVGGVASMLQLFDSPVFAVAFVATIGGLLAWLLGLVRVTR